MRLRSTIPGLLAALTGCNLMVPEGAWLRHRLDDLTEAAHVDLAASYALGALVNAGPALLGAHAVADLEFGDRRQLGLGGVVPLRTANGSGAAGVLVPISWARTETSGGEPIQGYRGRYPGYGSIGVDVGLLVGLGVRVDLVELADFLGGLAGADLLGDDEPTPPRDGEVAPSVPEDASAVGGPPA